MNNFKSIKKILSLINRYEDLQLREVCTEIVDTMNVALKSIGGAILMCDYEERQLKAYVHSNVGSFLEKVIPRLSKPFNEYFFSFDDKTNLLIKTVLERRSQISHDFSDFISPSIGRIKAKIMQRALNMRTIISLPVVANKKTLGVLMIGFNQASLKDEEMLLLEIFADQAAIAINNALQYEVLLTQHRQLEEKYELERSTTALLSHELKTPIAINLNNVHLIKLFLEKGHNGLAGQDVELLNKIHRELEAGHHRMNAICNSILDFREVENKIANDVQLLDVKKITEPIARIFKAKAEKKNLSFEVKTKILCKKTIYGAGIQFEQVLINLLENAIKYTRKGKISLHIKLDQKHIVATVTDTGIGIKNEDRDKIFERFKRGKRAGAMSDGLGLGLYISKKVTDHLGGSLDYKPGKKCGSVFRIRMPVLEKSS